MEQARTTFWIRVDVSVSAEPPAVAQQPATPHHVVLEAPQAAVEAGVVPAPPLAPVLAERAPEAPSEAVEPQVSLGTVKPHKTNSVLAIRAGQRTPERLAVFRQGIADKLQGKRIMAMLNQLPGVPVGKSAFATWRDELLVEMQAEAAGQPPSEPTPLPEPTERHEEAGVSEDDQPIGTSTSEPKQPLSNPEVAEDSVTPEKISPPWKFDDDDLPDQDNTPLPAAVLLAADPESDEADVLVLEKPAPVVTERLVPRSDPVEKRVESSVGELGKPIYADMETIRIYMRKNAGWQTVLVEDLPKVNEWCRLMGHPGFLLNTFVAAKPSNARWG